MRQPAITYPPPCSIVTSDTSYHVDILEHNSSSHFPRYPMQASYLHHADTMPG